uniref:Uncharacterized protein n=1 Tax=Romanomermis culicivorax TaxID=13658 RepID=A0A915HFQ2_ROMCU
MLRMTSNNLRATDNKLGVKKIDLRVTGFELGVRICESMSACISLIRAISKALLKAFWYIQHRTPKFGKIYDCILIRERVPE